jgi:uncharacterized heparinase superfamily protein
MICLLLLTAIETLHNTERRQLMSRLGRRVRYDYLYPWLGRYLFPMPKGGDCDFAKCPGVLHEDAAALNGSREHLLSEAQDFCQRRFNFLNLAQVDLGRPVNWNSTPDGDRLWQYNLHYGEWAITLARAYFVNKDIRFVQNLVELIIDWIDHNSVGRCPGWEPYPISRRVVSWSRVALALKEEPTWVDFCKAKLIPSLRQQGKFLAANLEHDLANNHLVANYKALAWLGLLFPNWPEASKWKAFGLDGLWKEMRRQVLRDGVHDERSISYHATVLQDLLEIWRLAKQTKEPVPENVEPTLVHMCQFLADTQAPGDTWPMVNDSVPDYPLDPRSLLLAAANLLGHEGWLAQAHGGDPAYLAWLSGQISGDPAGSVKRNPKGSVAFSEAGYLVLHDKDQNYLFFDAGPMGPKRIQGHGHADGLSFVLYKGEHALIVDPGVYSYHDKVWRDHFRSTIAHNTVAIDNQDQCVFCGPFRVAYPPKVRLLEWSENHVVGEHEGYSRFSKPVIHRRRIEKLSVNEWEILDQFEGRGEHEFALTLQLAPRAEAEIDGGFNALVRWPDKVSLEIIPVSPRVGSESYIEKGWVSQGWNLKEEAPRYVLRWKSTVPVENRLILKVNC